MSGADEAVHEWPGFPRVIGLAAPLHVLRGCRGYGIAMETTRAPSFQIKIEKNWKAEGLPPLDPQAVGA